VLFIWVGIGFGAVSLWKSRQRALLSAIVVATLAGVLLSTGLGIDTLIRAVPLFTVYREPQKFVILVALGYSLLLACGVDALVRVSARELGTVGRRGAVALVCILPIVVTEVMLWGCHGQLQSSTYPSDWFAVNAKLDSDPQRFYVLFLPWHFYMYFGFAGRIIGSPAPAFFDKPMVVSDNPELPGAASINPTITTQRLDMLLPTAGTGRALGASLATFGIKYVVLAKDDDYSQYSYLDSQRDLRLVYSGQTMDLYRNTAYGEQ
jgi:hypothetical protein